MANHATRMELQLEIDRLRNEMNDIREAFNSHEHPIHRSQVGNPPGFTARPPISKMTRVSTRQEWIESIAAAEHRKGESSGT